LQAPGPAASDRKEQHDEPHRDGRCAGARVGDLQLTVFDIDRARDALVARGVAVSEVFHDAGGVFHHGGTGARAAGPAPEHADHGSFASFRDLDGNGWLLQEINIRLPGRVSATTRYDDAQDAEYMVRERAGEELPS
jgi:hypothetical protein